MKADEKKSAFDLNAGPQLESPGPRASYMESDSPHEGGQEQSGIGVGTQQRIAA